MAALNILLVEDSQSWQRILQEKIRQALLGWTSPSNIRVVEQFEEAWEALNQEKPWHLLITDIGLTYPESRQKLGKQLVECAGDLQIPTIVVSGTPVLSKQEVGDLITEHKARAFFSKEEFDGKKFATKIRKILQIEEPQSVHQSSLG